MAFQAVPDGVEVVFHATQNTIPIVNVYHVRDTTSLTTARLEQIADIFKDWWDTFMAPILNPSYVLNDITVTALEASTGPQVIRSYTTSNQGTNSGGEAAANAAAVISWRTASIGRSYRGRTYIGALTESTIATAQTIDSSAVTAIADAAQGLLDALEGIGVALAVLSRFALLVKRATGVLTDIISFIVDNKVDSMRRRTAN